eukprot:13249775-Alexandrium_andersonii.AAC.1
MKDGVDLGIVCDDQTLEVRDIRPQSAAALYNQQLAEDPRISEWQLRPGDVLQGATMQAA